MTATTATLTEIRADGMQKWERDDMPTTNHLRYIWLHPFQIDQWREGRITVSSSVPKGNRRYCRRPLVDLEGARTNLN